MGGGGGALALHNSWKNDYFCMQFGTHTFYHVRSTNYSGYNFYDIMMTSAKNVDFSRKMYTFNSYNGSGRFRSPYDRYINLNFRRFSTFTEAETKLFRFSVKF